MVQDSVCRRLNDEDDTGLLLRRLDRLGRAEERTHRDVAILTEAFGTWVEIWFAHTPNLSEDHKPRARHSAAGRYAQFLEHVSRRFSHGHRFIDDLPQEPIADEAELTRLAIESVSRSDSEGSGKR